MSSAVASEGRESSLERPTVYGTTFKMFALCFYRLIYAFRSYTILKNKPFY